MTFRGRWGVAVFVLTLLGIQTLSAQPELDPRSDVYRAIDRWYAAGLIEAPLPIIRPYPRHVLLSLLRTVEQRAMPIEAAVARRYREAFTTDGANLQFSAIGDGAGGEVRPRARAGAQFRYRLGEQVDVGFAISGNAIARGSFRDPRQRPTADTEIVVARGGWEADNLPYADRFDVDVVRDNVPSFTAGGQTYRILPDVQTNFSYGNERLWVQAGIHRRSFGPNHQDSPVLSSDAPQQAGAAFTWSGRRHAITVALLSLSAGTRFKLPGPDSDPRVVGQTSGGDALSLVDSPGLVPGKLLYLQSIHVRVARWLDLGIMEAVVTGPRPEMAYLVPVKTLFLGQAISEFADNSLLGLTANVRPSAGVHVPLTIYVDDLNANQLARFNFDTKIKAATAVAVEWYAPPPMLERVRLSYDIVMPYMYTHADVDPYTDQPNYLDYRHRGVNLGSGLLPNSDRTRVAVMVTPLPRFGVELSGALIRHANAGEGRLDGYVNDGGYGDAGRRGEFRTVQTNGTERVVWKRGDLSFNDDRLFLEQRSIEHVYQTGVKAAWRTRAGSWDTEISGGVTYQYIDGPLSYVITNDGTGRTVAGADTSTWFFSLGVVLSR